MLAHIRTLAAGVLVFAASTAEAKTGHIEINVNDFYFYGSTARTPGYLRLPENGASYFSMSFTLPRDYRQNSPITIRLRYTASGLGCTFSFFNLGVFRARPGSVGSFSNGGASGLTPTPATTIALPTTNDLLKDAKFTLTRSTSGAVLKQKAGDIISLEFSRDGTDGANDTCAGNMYVAGARVIYTRN